MTFIDQNCWTEPAVTFDYSAWVARYPEFSNVSPQLAALYEAEAELYCRNKLGPIRNPATLLLLLNMLTAHIAWMFAPRDANGNPASTGSAAPNVVGQMTNANEGSVSIGTAKITNENAEWFAQTKYGLEFWQATAAFRTFRYFPSRRPVPSAIFPTIPGRIFVR